MRLLLAAWLLAALLPAWEPAWAQELLPVPALSARVIDQTGTLDAAQRSALESKLAAFEQASGPQIVVLMVAATAPEDIAAYAHRVADQWKIGRREVGDGLLIVVAKSDRRIRIEVAKALEGAVPDLAARQIIDRTITPAFRTGDFAGGLSAGVDALMARIRGEGLPQPQQQPRGPQDGSLEQLLLFFFVAVPVLGGILTKVLGRKLGALLTAGGAGAAAYLLSASMLLSVAVAIVAMVAVGIFGIGALRPGLGRTVGRREGPAGWGGGGFGHGGGFGGGGGFGSGGGGDFGGGGASGDW